MDASLFLAKLFGFYMLILAIAMAARQAHMKTVISTIMQSEGVMNFGSIVTIIFGLLLVLFHNMWVMDWRLILTLFCWWVLIKGCLHLFHPETLTRVSNCVLSHNNCFYCLIAFQAIFALFFLYHGFGV